MRLRFDANLAPVIKVLEHTMLLAGQTPHLIEATEAAGEFLKSQWIKTAHTKITSRTGGYIRGIRSGESYPHKGNPLHYVITNTASYAAALEDGFDPFDMRRMLDTSKKVRISKDGNRYLIIPFRHGKPGSKVVRPMPEEVYGAAKQLSASRITGRRLEGVQQGARSYDEAQMMKENNPEKVKRNTYRWGDHLEVTGDPSMARYNNMYRFDKRTSDGQQYSHYMTFRVISDASRKTSWQHPGVPAMNIAGEAYEAAKPHILRLLDDALQQDIDRLIS